MSNIGYVRVSSAGQNTDRQLANLKVKLDRTFSDKATGANMQRPGLQELLEYARVGDTVYFHAIDRVARSALDWMKIRKTLTGNGATVVIVNRNIIFTSESTDPMQKAMADIEAVFAELERSISKQRQKEGIAAAKKRGVVFGPKPKLTGQNKEDILATRNAGRSQNELAKEYGVSRTTIQRALGLI